MSPTYFHHQLQLYSSTQDIPYLELPPSVLDAGFLLWNSNTSQKRDSDLLSPTTPTHVSYVPCFFVPSSLQSPLNDIRTLCTSYSLAREKYESWPRIKDWVRLMVFRYRPLKQTTTMKSLERVNLHKLCIWFSKLCFFHHVWAYIPNPYTYNVYNKVYE